MARHRPQLLELKSPHGAGSKPSSRGGVCEGITKDTQGNGWLCSLSDPTLGPRSLVVWVGGDGMWVNCCQDSWPRKQKKMILL